MQTLFENKPTGHPFSRNPDPLVDDGMVALIRWLEASPLASVDAAELHSLSRITASNQPSTRVYLLSIGPPEIVTEINLRGNPEGRSRRPILSAHVKGDGWTLTRTQLLLSRDILPDACAQVMEGRIDAMRGLEIVTHPYLTGAWTQRGSIKEREVVMNLQRSRPSHILGVGGIEKIRRREAAI